VLEEGPADLGDHLVAEVGGHVDPADHRPQGPRQRFDLDVSVVAHGRSAMLQSCDSNGRKPDIRGELNEDLMFC
jgi:hypothetical protein